MIALIHAPIVTYFSYPVSHLLGALYFPYFYKAGKYIKAKRRFLRDRQHESDLP